MCRRMKQRSGVSAFWSFTVTHPTLEDFSILKLLHVRKTELLYSGFESQLLPETKPMSFQHFSGRKCDHFPVIFGFRVCESLVGEFRFEEAVQGGSKP